MNKSESIKAIAAAIILVMQEVKNIEKNAEVGSGTYKYSGVSDKDVKQQVGAAMVKFGLCIVPTGIASKAEMARWNEGGRDKQQVFVEVTTTYLLMHAESGEWLEITGYGHGIDTMDKAAGKATTYGLKYALLYTFMIATGKIDDADTTHSKDLPVPQIIEQVITDMKKCATQKELNIFYNNLQSNLKNDTGIKNAAKLMQDAFKKAAEAARVAASPFKKKYETVEELTKLLESAKEVKDIANLYYINSELVDKTPALKTAFTAKKNEFYGGVKEQLPPASAAPVEPAKE